MPNSASQILHLPTSSEQSAYSPLLILRILVPSVQVLVS